MAELRNLIMRRGQLKSSLTRFEKFIRELSEGDEIDQLKLRRQKIEDIWSEFDQVQSAIEIESEEESQAIYRKEFEDVFFKSVAAADSFIQNKETPKVNKRVPQIIEADEHNISLSKLPINLPPVTLPNFSGDYYEWSTFYDLFNNLIHTNTSLMPIQKFFYLRGSLSGDALNSIKCLSMSAENYTAAWETLTERFNNTKVIVQSHVKAICDMELLSSESAIKLRQFIDKLSNHIQSLRTLGYEPNNWGPLMVHMVMIKLDKMTLRAWETSACQKKVAEPNELLEFLESRFKILESMETSKTIATRVLGVNDLSSKNQNIKKNVFTKSFAVAVKSLECFVCKGPHTIYHCPTFLALSVQERINKVNELKLCRICLRLHSGKKCLSKYCLRCSKPHNSLLHFVQRTPPIIADLNVNNITAISESVEPTATTSAHNAIIPTLEQVVLSTAVVSVRDNNNKVQPCRLLLDSGSQSNFISETLVQELKLKKRKIAHTVIGIGETIKNISASVEIQIESRVNNFCLNIRCLVVPKVTGSLPTRRISENVQMPGHIVLADPLFRNPQKVDVLLGAEQFYEVLETDRLKIFEGGPTAQKTKFGWVVSGPIPERIYNNLNTNSKSFHVSEKCDNCSDRLEGLLTKFWKLESIEKEYPFTLEENNCKEIFDHTVTRDETGRFIVKLPFRNQPTGLGGSYEIAKRRLLCLEKRFKSNVKLKAEYSKFLLEYANLGHMTEVINEKEQDKSLCCYLPHHAVYNENSTTTKIRVVFDASCKTESGVSLNDCLLKGPTIQDELIYILARFRTHKFVLTGDIVKMYRQIRVTEADKRYQQILWRENPEDAIRTFKLETITYGTAPASFLATACLKRLADEEKTNYPKACEVLGRDFYMDDLLTGAQSREEIVNLQGELIAVLKKAGMELSKWASNIPDLLSDSNDRMKVKLKETEGLLSSNSKLNRVLGLLWEAHSDVFKYNVLKMTADSNITKRIILSYISTIFDPLGFVGPVVLRCKLLIQKLWQSRIGWDEPLSEELVNEWRSYSGDLLLLNSISIARRCGEIDNCTNIQVHGFADASLKAYGACIYLRCTNNNGNRTVHLIGAKSKVAPLKTITLPRLELCAALLLVRLVNKFIPKLNLNIQKKMFWSDSRVTLAWIASSSSQWKTFVANRVGEIQSLSDRTEWAHVRGEENPADIISRGSEARQLVQNERWWSGPEWLSKGEDEWPINSDSLILNNKELEVEAKGVQALSSIARSEFSLLTRCSSLNKIWRIIAYCLRYRDRIKKDLNGKPLNRMTGPILVHEVERAEKALVHIVQNEYFSQEIKCLKGPNGQVSQKSKLFRLQPFLDKSGLLRVGGRLKNAASLEIFQKHPLIIPAKSTFTKLLLRNEHERLCHSGPQTVLASIRQRYWPLNARNTIRGIIFKCLR
ncbi:uncharacterized protein LOC126906529 [Daktulosphaira vitifoliae]|uniref:uncharacterized protein LOC126906529 n=1 Tax=Daktulosphaira vitifoliae TaxID=58002 RepID=UPI0021A9C8AA|nr:uncharacterized protein LOC126906529 [Daktulosphaira vitifoliae]